MANKIGLNDILKKNLPVETYSDKEEKKEDDKRFQIALYVSKEEKSILQEKAKKTGMKISQYIRFKIFNDNI
ncbi:hypothetical protein BKH41_08565 [Helicobacter sp. 12S02232-10]|uniref:plasmid mobilization protein n=1 Tax=Helicobacter sp. 12S02232-10 TaxID=1476197 RepID=UPI000BA575FD|nr:hypothetical protein [Helicobacter sp. 12S02232-10]PAF46752.1 hypothetical protein BKH41_08565 [Helicobacter sp. 12S02232-10]